MTTTPPTPAEADAFMAAPINDLSSGLLWMVEQMFPAESTTLAAFYTRTGGGYDSVLWIIGYTDNADAQHFESLGMSSAQAAGATDEELEASFPLASPNSVFAYGGILGGDTPAFHPIPYVNQLIETYGSVLIRGYLIPAIAPFAPVDDTVQTWVNDPANWGQPT
jgi:hypothetical protein